MQSSQINDRIAREQEFHDHAYDKEVRSKTAKYYGITEPCWEFYESFIWQHSPGKTVMEYGCGQGGYTVLLCDIGGKVTGIDISPVALQGAHRNAVSKGFEVTYSVMNAEQMAFADNSYDLIYGAGILHHLNLESAMKEIVRTLKPDGQAIFLEPLGHNPVLNLYRRLTPNYRTPDEHPLLMKDLKLMQSYFGEVEFHFYNMVAMALAPLGDAVEKFPLTNPIHKLDQQLFRWIPPLRRYAWNANLVFKKPIKSRAT